MRTQELKGHLDLMLPAVIEDGPRHGYAVIEELRRRSGDALSIRDSGTAAKKVRMYGCKLSF